uniref:Uncharacterized protein n=1 Tax=Anguilla anguilla TaxID=7936 RepID=A0A0E9U1E0_ANGAN
MYCLTAKQVMRERRQRQFCILQPNLDSILDRGGSSTHENGEL